MFPEPALPDAALAALDPGSAERLVVGQGADEPALDQAPAAREVRVVGWQGPDRMQVLGKHDEGVDAEGLMAKRPARRFPERIDVFDERGGPAVQERHREEPRSAGDVATAEIRHRHIPYSTKMPSGTFGVVRFGGIRFAIPPYGGETTFAAPGTVRRPGGRSTFFPARARPQRSPLPRPSRPSRPRALRARRRHRPPRPCRRP